jgi:hypothetical protein
MLCPVPHIVQYIYINDTPQTSNVYLGLFPNGTCAYHETHVRHIHQTVLVLRKLIDGKPISRKVVLTPALGSFVAQACIDRNLCVSCINVS